MFTLAANQSAREVDRSRREQVTSCDERRASGTRQVYSRRSTPERLPWAYASEPYVAARLMFRGTSLVSKPMASPTAAATRMLLFTLRSSGYT